MRLITQLKQMTLFHYRTLLRNKIAFFFNLVMPLLFLLIFGAMYGRTGTASIAIGLADHDGGPAAQAIRRALDSSSLYKVVEGEESDLNKQLDNAKIRAVLVIPKGTSEQVARKQGPAEVVIHWDPTNASSSAAQGGLQYLIAGLDLGGRSGPPSLVVRSEVVDSVNRMNVFDFMMPGMLVYMMLNAGVVSVAITVAYQRKNGTLRHMFSTPLSISTWLAGRILANMVLSVVQIALVWMVGLLIFKVHPPTNLLGTAAILFLSAIAGMAIGLAIGALVKNGDAAQPVALVIAMGLTFLGNAMMPLDGAPETVLTLMKFMPSYYMTHALQRVMMKGQALLTVGSDLAILAATAVIFLSLASWRLRKMFVVNA